MRSAAFFSIAFLSTAAAQVSQFNGKEIPASARDGEYRMILSGHFHGSSNNRSGYPAATLLANIDRINSSGADLLLSTGDLFLDPQADQARYERSLFSKLGIPLFNVPGNHDRNDHYERAFGPSHGLIELGRDRIILLDTEENDGSLPPDQLKLLQDQVHSPPHRIFIISHRPLWAEVDEDYGPLFEGNTRSLLGTNYRKDVEPLLKELAQRSQVYWISGSMAGGARSSIFFQQHAPNLTFIQTAIRNEQRDALLIADVKPDTIIWSTMSLTGAEVLPPQEYNAQWWWGQRGRSDRFNWRLLPYLIRSTVTHRAFWYGAAAGILLVLIFLRTFRRGL